MRQDVRSREQLLNEIDRLRKGSYIEEAGKTIRVIVSAGCIAFVAWCGKEAMLGLSGADTTANIVVSVLGRLEIAAIFSLSFGGAGVLYGLGQRSLRRSTVRRLQARIQAFERRSDPSRSSSMLTPEGTTNPEDL